MSGSALQFEIIARSARSAARLGRVHTPHGSFDTPAFMPVGTKAAVKGLFPGMVRQTGAQVVLANTYHLLLRPGEALIAARGGLHRFMNWHGPILTDSGGYQAYSMAAVNRVTDEDILFKSIIDGSDVCLTPERAIHIQNQLGADMIMALDDCPPSTPLEGEGSVTRARPGSAFARDSRPAGAQRGLSKRGKRGRYDHAARLQEANERTVRWLERSKGAHQRAQDQALFGIVQGGTDLGARSWCAERVTAIDLPGYAIGGVAVGEQSEDIERVVTHTAPLLPDTKPRYLMGVGYERDLLCACLAGVDMFDCVLPTRNGRNANAFTPSGQIRLRNAQYAEDDRPIQPGCDCPACQPKGEWDAAGPENEPGRSAFGRAYIRHLFMAGEMLGPIMVSLHNLRYFQRLMVDIRATIRDDDWSGLVSRWPMAVPGLANVRWE
jgi:queuine tRNA-ribosyltransferase